MERESRGLVWMWRQQQLEGYPGFKLGAALKVDPWTLVVGIPREQNCQRRSIRGYIENTRPKVWDR